MIPIAVLLQNLRRQLLALRIIRPSVEVPFFLNHVHLVTDDVEDTGHHNTVIWGPVVPLIAKRLRRIFKQDVTLVLQLMPMNLITVTTLLQTTMDRWSQLHVIPDSFTIVLRVGGHPQILTVRLSRLLFPEAKRADTMDSFTKS